MPDPSTDLRAALDHPALARAALDALPAAARAVLAAEAVDATRLVEHAEEALLVDARLLRAGVRLEHPADDPVERLLLALPARARTRALALAEEHDDASLAPDDPFPRTFPARAVKRRGAVDTEATLVDLVLDLAGWDGRGALLEPAVGRGAFLARAWARALDAGVAPDDAARGLVGVDVHPFACRAARVRLALLAAERGLADSPRPTVHLGDALDGDPRWPAGAFDLVVGNPPYVRGERLPAAARARLRARWPDLGAGNVDLAAYFVRRALDWLRPGPAGGRLAFVLTQGVCDARAAEGLRARLGAGTLEALVGFEWAPPQFSDATVIPCVLVARRAPAPPGHAVVVSSARAAATTPGLALTTARVPQRDFMALGRGRWPVEVVDDDLPLLRALDAAPRPLVAGYGLAIRTRARAGTLIADAGSPEAARFACPRPLLDGREVRAYSIDWGGRLIDYRPDVISDPKSEAFFAAPKVVMARIALSTQAAVDDEPGGPFFARNTVMIVRAPGTALDDEPHALCAVINSLPLRAYAFLVLRAGALAGSHRATFYSGVIGAFPVPAALLDDRARAADLAALARRARDLARAGAPDERRRVQDAIDDAVADAYGLAPAVRDHLRARAASTPLAQVLRAPRAGAPLRRIALREWTAGARYR